MTKTRHTPKNREILAWKRHLLPALMMLLTACATAPERPKLSPNATADEKIIESARLYQQDDYTGTIALIKPLAEQGNATAQNQYGIMFFFGEGVELDYQQAAFWFGKAADQGHALAQTNLGSMHLNGKGMKQDYVEAARLLRLAAEQNTGSAQAKLAIMYGEGTGVPKDLVEAYSLFTLAIDNDVPDARELRGNMLPYMSADEVAEGEARAKAWKAKRP